MFSKRTRQVAPTASPERVIREQQRLQRQAAAAASEAGANPSDPALVEEGALEQSTIMLEDQQAGGGGDGGTRTSPAPDQGRSPSPAIVAPANPTQPLRPVRPGHKRGKARRPSRRGVPPPPDSEPPTPAAREGEDESKERGHERHWAGARDPPRRQPPAPQQPAPQQRTAARADGGGGEGGGSAVDEFFKEHARRAKELRKKKPKPAELAMQEMNANFASVNQRLRQAEYHTVNDVRAVESHLKKLIDDQRQGFKLVRQEVQSYQPSRRTLALRFCAFMLFVMAFSALLLYACTALLSEVYGISQADGTTSFQSAMFVDRSGKLGLNAERPEHTFDLRSPPAEPSVTIAVSSAVASFGASAARRRLLVPATPAAAAQPSSQSLTFGERVGATHRVTASLRAEGAGHLTINASRDLRLDAGSATGVVRVARGDSMRVAIGTPAAAEAFSENAKVHVVGDTIFQGRVLLRRETGGAIVGGRRLTPAEQAQQVANATAALTLAADGQVRIDAPMFSRGHSVEGPINSTTLTVREAVDMSNSTVTTRHIVNTGNTTLGSGNTTVYIDGSAGKLSVPYLNVSSNIDLRGSEL
eukprot:g7167.t1